ncbi:NADPH-dependent 7-cyano-7-deazaguanine reductase QueF [Marinilabiliaceae bacterium JC017]|nr:NADPH-dependent 7-cyano-7-deazaguanine reductase QueF [Marinilabiliaceae bacterium JC017]
MKNLIEGKYLGKKVDYPKSYSPDILVAVPRQLNRDQYHLRANYLPFTGKDTWHAYEIGFLTKKGLPVSGVMKFVYPATNEFLVESKSLKLYLNSFNMDRFGNTPIEGIQIISEKIKKDLNKLLNTNVELNFFPEGSEQSSADFSGYQVLEQMPVASQLTFTDFKETPQLLHSTDTKPSTLKIATHLLRSNCKITHQPDWGSAFIHIKSTGTPDLSSILKYIVSFRNENHFHEEICEMLYKRLWDAYAPEELAVTCIYTRRGGIDICPARASEERLLPKHLTSTKAFSQKLLKQ